MTQIPAGSGGQGQKPPPAGSGGRPPARVFNDRYELVRHVARGGMAQVYLAKDLLLDRPVALKVLFPELSVDRSFVERFRREAQAAANLSHPNIVSIYDWGEGEHTYFIVMEYIDGRTLAQLLRQGPLDAEHAARIGADVAAALSFAHQHRILHRDCKPGNILIDKSGQVKVTDFGIARAMGAKEGLTQTGTVMGTATYFSPEQAQGYEVDARSDVYSLGVVLYEMVTGRPPFSGDNPIAIAYKHVREEAIAPTLVNRAVPPSLEAIILQAMAKDPSERYQSADDLRTDLTRYVQGSSVMAQPARPLAASTATGVQASYTQGRQAASSRTRVQPAAEPIEPAGRRSGAYVAVLVLMLLVLAGLLFLLGKGLGVFGGSGTARVTIPQDLVGKSVADATSELRGLGFRVNPTSPDGTVTGSDPSAGATAAKDSTVILKVTAAPVQVPVPDVRNIDVTIAETTLRQAGFLVVTQTQTSSTVPVNTVIDQNPKPPATLAKGQTITLIVSSGQAKVQIPDESGKDPAVAGADLGGRNLKVGNPVNEASATVPTGRVTRTNPPAGTMVTEGTTVTVYVSSGVQQVSIPDVRSQTAAAAQSALTTAGFVVQQNQVTTNQASKDGLVISQNPSGGGTAPKGTTVTITIGQFNGSTTTPSTSPGTTTTSMP